MSGIFSLLSFFDRISVVSPLNLFDYIFIIIACIYVYEEISFRMLASFKHDIFVAIAYFSSLFVYLPLSHMLQSSLFLAKGTADGISVISIIVIVLPLLYIASFYARDAVQFSTPGGIVNRVVSFILGMFSFFVISSLIIILLLSFPMSITIHNSVLGSFFGRSVSLFSQKMEINLKKSAGLYTGETLLFLTQKLSDPTIHPLHANSFKQGDFQTATTLFNLINTLRRHNRVPLLEKDVLLTNVSQLHAENMGTQGFLSHYTPGGISLYDRLEVANISVGQVSESIAYAPSADIALQGMLSMSDDQVALISSQFKKIGIGVVDSQSVGKLFVVVLTQ